MAAVDDIQDFDEDECLCQMKVVPEDKRIDFLQIVEKKDGKRRWSPVLRFHKDCVFHGIKVTNAPRT